MKIFSHTFSLLSLFRNKFMRVVVPVFFVMIVLLPFHADSQKIDAVASVDTNSILIGKQLILSLEVKHPSDVLIEWPSVADTFSLFEIVTRSQVDTVAGTGDKSVTKRQHFKITSFDSGYHVIPPFTFNYRLPGDTGSYKAETEPLLIAVQSIQVDTTRAIKDIKGQIVIPFTWQDLLPYIFGVLIVLLVIALVYFIIKKFRPTKQAPVIQVPKRPAHEIALEALQQLESAKLWQQGNYKLYFTGLSDITRTFIQNRWAVAAMEMTTDEILRMKIISGQEPEVLVKLKNLLELADLVKFAKVIPVLHENEQSMQYAVAFVKANMAITETEEVVT